MDFFKKRKKSNSDGIRLGKNLDAFGQQDESYDEVELTEPGESASRFSLLTKLGLFSVAVFIVSMFFLGGKGTVDNSPAAKSALQNGFSQTLTAGTLLLAADSEAQGRDYTVKVNSQDLIQGEQNTKVLRVLVWDYAAEDGDYVQLIYNGVPLSEPFMIKHKPREFLISPGASVSSTLLVKGIRDGGGGITYAVMLSGKNEHFSFYNAAPINKSNTYTLNLY